MKMPPWSYSSLTNFESCGWKYYLTKVAKEVPDPPGEAALWGTRVHEALEYRVKNGTPLPEGMTQYEPLCAKFDNAKGDVFTEKQYALTADFKLVDWMDPTAWVRGIIDLGVVNGKKAALFDWKTGKPKSDSDQLMLFAAFAMHEYPKVEQVSTAFLWIAHNKTTKAKYTREDLPGIWQEFIPRVQRMERAFEQDKWKKNPSGLCNGWCPVGKGRCEFWKPKRT